MHIQNDRLRTTYYYSPNPQRRPLPKQKSSRRGILPVAIGGILAVTAAFFIARAQSSGEAGAISSKQPPTAQAPAAQQPPEPAKNRTTDAEMASIINQAIANSPDIDISVSIIDLEANKTYHYGLDAIFDEASVGKLLTAIIYLHKVQQGEASLSTDIGGVPARQNLQKLIEQSDNVAWKSLNDFITHEYMLEYMQSQGFAKYNPKTNTVDSNAIAQLLGRLYKGKLLNKTHTQLLLGHMKNANRTDYVLAGLPAGVKAYHKAGWLEDRNHDAVIVDDGYDPYVLVIFTNGHRKYHPTTANSIIQEITQATVARFIGK
jgi:beta-lactamase class A